MTPAKAPLRVLVIGQTPPPFGGQAVMIRHLLEGRYSGVELIHVPMNFSRDMNEMGRWKFSKIRPLFLVVTRGFWSWIRYRPQVLYYPPSGPVMLPMMRDMAVLLSLRWMFRRTVFHFHASGLTARGASFSGVLRLLYRKAFGRPDLAIHLAAAAPAEGENLGARRSMIVPNGIPDTAGTEINRSEHTAAPVRILFMGMLSEDKGVLVALEALAMLRDAGHPVTLTCAGRWSSPGFQQTCEDFIDQRGLREQVSFPGVVTGETKSRLYREADIFCFPSFFHSETFPLVLLEAMCFSLPIVSTEWRGIPEVVASDNAVLVPPRDAAACADALAALIRDPALRLRMGHHSRERFVARFSIEAHWKAMEEAFTWVGNDIRGVA